MSRSEKPQFDKIGYARPPGSTRFRKGQSGNPRGRPPGRAKGLPYDAVLGQMVTIREDGIEKQLTAAEAFLLQITRKGLDGDGAAARAAMAAIEEARAARESRGGSETRTIISVLFVETGSVNSALEPLRLARKLDRYHDASRMMLEPWIVEAALARLGNRRLTLDEQQTVVKATRTPNKVKWPSCWRVKPIDSVTTRGA